MDKIHIQLLEEINLMLKDYPLALDFIIKYNQYVHDIDDIVDESLDKHFIVRTFGKSCEIFSHPFWLKNSEFLQVTEALINNDYADSLIWEESLEEWKIRDGKCLSHSGYRMFFAVLYVCLGYDAMRSVSIRFREFSHLKHLNDNKSTSTNETNS